MKANSEKGIQSPRRWSEQFELFSLQPFSGYQLLGREELRKLPHPKWAIKGVLPSRGIALLYGPSGSGKSFITFDMALAIQVAQAKAPAAIVVRQAQQPIDNPGVLGIEFGLVPVAALADREHLTGQPEAPSNS